VNPAKVLAHSQDVATKVARVFHKRLQKAQTDFSERTARAREIAQDPHTPASSLPAIPSPQDFFDYAVDAAQRQLLFWDTLRQRGDNFVERSALGLKPVLHFDYEVVLDARSFDRPVNYALLRITPPDGVIVDDTSRPYLIIDPRAGHGPGIGGFKDDSQAGVAMRAGHPVYFVIFYPEPEPGQTLLDVCEAEQRFLRTLREMHPKSPKAAVIGNCQGGWAAMMLAASSPDDTGPIVINGAPMSYWSGAWSEGEGDNPMRYSGGLLGGSWLASLSADLGNGKFDGAYLVQNFESLNPANSLWDKYYHLYDEADTEPPRFLDFERWWGGYYLMNREEIEWITRNLFVGNRLWSGDVKSASGEPFDLREVKVPIILFASMGDNITPPQQAFNWVADVYASTDEIKERGQVIVGLLHESIGHLGIFVSGKVARKEHTQIVSVLEAIEMLPPGLYGMSIREHGSRDGQPQYEVDFQEHRLEDIVGRINRFARADERPFEAVAAVSDFNQRAYELFAQPLVQAGSNEYSAQMLREFHPLRLQNWAMSASLNPWMAWLQPAAEGAKSQRRAMSGDHPMRRGERAGAEMLSASLDCWRAVRDACTEAGFFTLYSNLHALYLADRELAGAGEATHHLHAAPPAEAAADQGGYVEALARTAYLLGHRNGGGPLPLSRLEMRQDLVRSYTDFLPHLDPHTWRTIRGEQEVIARRDPQQAVATLPQLLCDETDRARFTALLNKIESDPRVQGAAPSAQQHEMFEHIRETLAEAAPALRAPPRRRRASASHARGARA